MTRETTCDKEKYAIAREMKSASKLNESRGNAMEPFAGCRVFLIFKATAEGPGSSPTPNEPGPLLCCFRLCRRPYLPLRDRLMRVTMSSQSRSSRAG